MLYRTDYPNRQIDKNSELYRSPNERGIKYEEIEVKTEDGQTLYGWFMFHNGFGQSKEMRVERDTVLFFHENIGNIGHRLDYFETLYKRVNVNIVCIEFRGYGQSTGTPSQQGLLYDAKAALEFVKKCDKINKDRVFLIGRSLGGSVALHLLADLKEPFFKGTVIESTFTSMKELAEVRFPFLSYLKFLKDKLLRVTWDNLK